MPLDRAGLVALTIVASIVAAGAGMAQTAGSPAPGTDAAMNGAALVAKNCFQCHTDTMFRDQRQDERAWKATIYRMVGRGGLWTPDEIDAMAAYLGTALGPDVNPVAAKSK